MHSDIIDQQGDMTAERRLYEEAARRAIEYRADIVHRRVGPPPEAVAGLDRFDESFPRHSTDPQETISLLDEVGSPATMGMAGPRFFGFVIGGSLPVTVAANWIATAWDQNTGLYTATPGTSKLEEVGLRWMNEIFGFPPSTGCAFVTGATMANFTALAAARSHVLSLHGWDVEADGLFGAPEITVVIGKEAHPTLTKSLGLLGLGRSRTVVVPVDNQGRMVAGKFPRIASPAIVCIQAGNVNTGSFDPAEEIIAQAHEAGAWVHVDSAFGLWALASPAYSHLARGVEKADSWATDAHKWLNVPYDCGLAFVREPERLRSAMSFTAAYLPRTEFREPSQYTPELSRRARGVEVWAALRSLGRNGLRDMIDRGCTNATRFADGLRKAGYAVLNDVVLNQVLVSFGPPEVTTRVIARIQDEGTCWCGGTVWQEQTAMRISVSGWSTTENDVDRSLEVMIRIADEERRKSG